jgi:hypothetical protein
MGKGLLALIAALTMAIFCATASADLPVLSPLPKDPFGQGHSYVNPFADPAWSPARTDMGVDWIPAKPLPVLAIGDAVIIGSDSRDTGWPGNHFIFYALLNGSHAGDVIYVAEHLRAMVPTGTYVRAGQRIATAVPGSPYTEWGWATSYGETLAHSCYTFDGKKTAAGKEMARFMISLGAQVRDRPGQGPDKPQGGRCT